MAKSFTTPASRWAALTSRDPLAANAFIYSVTTTRIYCRPTCPSRLARRANVVFHDTAAAARANGFRPCKRCRPDDLDAEQGDAQVQAVMAAKRTLESERWGRKKSVRELAKEAGLTESHFCRVFKKITGVTVREYRMSLTSNSATTIDQDADAEEASLEEGVLLGLDGWREWPSWVMEDQARGDSDGLDLDMDELLNCFPPDGKDVTSHGCINTAMLGIANAGAEDYFDFLDFDNQIT